MNLGKFASFLGIFSGTIFGVIFIILLSLFPFRFDSNIYRLLGIRKPLIVGFQPFWLLQNESNNSVKYLNFYTYFGLTIDSQGKLIKLVNEREEEPGWTTLKTDSFLEKLNHIGNKDNVLSLLVHTSDEKTIQSLLDDPKGSSLNLINDIKPLMQKYHFSDLNLDIESFREASSSDRLKFSSFLDEVKKSLTQENLGTLTLEISPSTFVRNFIINPEDIGKIADYIVIMAYDYHYAGSYLAGPIAPLIGATKVREYDVETGLKETLKVIPNNKIILGIPLYGYEWETLENKLGAATIPGSGSTASNKRATKLLTECNDCKKVKDMETNSTFIIFPEENYFHIISYEDEESLSNKLKLAEKYKIAGVALWALGYESDTMLKPLTDYKKLQYF